MTTAGPTLGPTGVTVPDYPDIFAELQNAYQSIYGSDASLDADTQDGQFLAIFAQACEDCGNAAQDVYNAFQLNGAQGAGLSSIVKIAGVRRAVAGYSTDTLTVTGTPNQLISGGQVGDNLGQGTIWSLPATVQIPASGSINVTITNTAPGATTFAPGDIDVILTPTYGWDSAINIGPATAGAAVEDDASLRETASNSTAGPSNTVLEAVYAAIANVANVTRFTVYENDTDGADGNGQGAHSIYAVVQGGTVADIVNAIGSKKSPGTTTLGTTSGTYVDTNGVPDVIGFYQLTQVTITVIVSIEIFTGYATSTAVLIQAAIAQYLSGLNIGEKSYLNRLLSAANLSGDAATAATGMTQPQLDALSATYNVTAILQSRTSDAPPAAQDVPIAFNEAAACSVANVTVNT